MAHFLCMDGLGGQPETTFGFLKEYLEKAGHTVALLVPIGRTHQERVDRIHETIKLWWNNYDDIFIVGQSAGGSAARIACSGEIHRGIRGLVLLSPAMPAGIRFLTKSLVRAMIRPGNLKKLITGQGYIVPSEKEYARLIDPLPMQERDVYVSARTPIPAHEARELAFYPPEMQVIRCPTLLFYGTQDCWINPQAHEKFGKKLEDGFCTQQPLICPIVGVGHLTLASPEKEKIARIIDLWAREKVGR